MGRGLVIAKLRNTTQAISLSLLDIIKLDPSSAFTSSFLFLEVWGFTFAGSPPFPFAVLTAFTFSLTLTLAFGLTSGVLLV